MTSVPVSRLVRRASLVARGLCRSLPINAKMLKGRLSGRRNVVFHVGASTQLMHVEDVIRELQRRETAARISVHVFTKPSEVAAAASKLDAIAPGIPVHPDHPVRFLLFCDLYSTVDQGEAYPLLGCRIRACSFHGQPSKGNVYQRFNYRQINTLFFYGPLMRDHYLETRGENPSWPPIAYYEVGQPLSDRRMGVRTPKLEARSRLGLDGSRFTVLYAPSFEYCSSLATDGRKIIDALLALGINLIVKPHPAFYNTSAFEDDFNRDVPTAVSWRGWIESRADGRTCLFPVENTLDAALAIAASDVMVTDFSGVAFDGILQDLGMIFWDCPTLFDEYLPRRYGVDGRRARAELACNVGRDAGIVVTDEAELAAAVQTYRKDPGRLSREREEIRGRLLFNPGRATAAMADAIEKLLSTEGK